jgi:hypothetical protein
MIARIWRGWAPLVTASDYKRHYQAEVGRHLRAVGGFRGGRLLRQEDGQEVMFTPSRSSPAWTPSADSPGKITNGPSSRTQPGRR